MINLPVLGFTWLWRNQEIAVFFQWKQTVGLLHESPAYCLEGPEEQYLDIVCSRWSEGTAADVANVPAALSPSWRCGWLFRPRLVLSFLTQRSEKKGCNIDKLSFGYSELHCYLHLSILKKKRRKKSSSQWITYSVVWMLRKVRPLRDKWEINIWHYKCKKNAKFGYGQKVKDVWGGQGQNSYQDKPNNSNNNNNHKIDRYFMKSSQETKLLI